MENNEVFYKPQTIVSYKFNSCYGVLCPFYEEIFFHYI